MATAALNLKPSLMIWDLVLSDLFCVRVWNFYLQKKTIENASRHIAIYIACTATKIK